MWEMTLYATGIKNNENIKDGFINNEKKKFKKPHNHQTMNNSQS